MMRISSKRQAKCNRSRAQAMMQQAGSVPERNHLAPRAEAMDHITTGPSKNISDSRDCRSLHILLHTATAAFCQRKQNGNKRNIAATSESPYKRGTGIKHMEEGNRVAAPKEVKLSYLGCERIEDSKELELCGAPPKKHCHQPQRKGNLIK